MGTTEKMALGHTVQNTLGHLVVGSRPTCREASAAHLNIFESYLDQNLSFISLQLAVAQCVVSVFSFASV